MVGRRFAGVGAAVTALAAVAVMTPAVGVAQCDPNWSRNVWTDVCTPPPPMPAWYQSPPQYAPPFAPADVPPPPPPPPWAPSVNPVWDPGHQAWGIWAGSAWIPL
ncbi:hypothetical protein [Mycobacterium botniense]|uniref:hypothetical protein n=1 Tax=Mycobacterium botniense TaxID=84962 RepID=UPI0013D7DB1A|nr:hypothetical protein [Mycobacterium botniense]